jgi:hypothetical protein
MAPNGKNKSDVSRIIINVAGVSRNTRVGELSVSQFIEVVSQLTPQLVAALRKDRVANMDKALSEIRKNISNSVDTNEGIAKAVRDAQLAILGDIPEIMKRVFHEKPQRGQGGK